MDQTSLAAELETARTAARDAGAAAMRFYGTTEWDRKADASPVTDADRAANELITERIRAAFPGDAILSEESADSPARLAAHRVWIVDPLDGTREFLAQNGEFSVLIGLVVEGAPVLGVVFLPATGVLYEAARGTGAWVESGGARRRLRRVESAPGASVRMVGSRSHPDPLLARMQMDLGITDIAPCGSVGVKCSRIVDGDRQLYVHPVGHLKEWDTCAPEVLFTEAGDRVTDCRGDPLTYNKPVPVQAHGIFAATPAAYDASKDRILALYAEEQGRGKREQGTGNREQGTGNSRTGRTD